MSTIANEMKDGFLDRILVDALNTALAARIVRRFVDQSAIALTPSNGLSRDRLNRVQDYIAAHLDDRLSLTELAGVACLSPYHFSRSFKQATGRAAALRHAAAARTGKNLDAAEQSAAGFYRAGGRLRRPEPSNGDSPPRDRDDTGPIMKLGMSGVYSSLPRKRD
jgi:Bacterial regulatory helix-turn-helix proteins, AraC family